MSLPILANKDADKHVHNPGSSLILNPSLPYIGIHDMYYYNTLRLLAPIEFHNHHFQLVNIDTNRLCTVYKIKLICSRRIYKNSGAITVFLEFILYHTKWLLVDTVDLTMSFILPFFPTNKEYSKELTNILNQFRDELLRYRCEIHPKSMMKLTHMISAYYNKRGDIDLYNKTIY